MKTLTFEECCDEVAKKYNYKSGESLLRFGRQSQKAEAAELYASSKVAELEVQNELLKVSYRNEQTLRESCEKALSERDAIISELEKEMNDKLNELDVLRLREINSQSIVIAELEAEYNKLGVKFDKEVERWTERDHKQQLQIHEQEAEIKRLREEIEGLKEEMEGNY